LLKINKTARTCLAFAYFIISPPDVKGLILLARGAIFRASQLAKANSYLSRRDCRKAFAAVLLLGLQANQKCFAVLGRPVGLPQTV